MTKNKYGCKEDVIDELIRMQDEGSFMRVIDMPDGLYSSIQKYYGGYEKAKKELGIDKRKDKIISEMAEVVKEVDSVTELREKYRALTARVERAYGSLKNFEKETGISVPRKRAGGKRKYTDEQLEAFIHEIMAKGKTSTDLREGSRDNRRIYDACVKRWGSWGKSVVRLGYTVSRTSNRLGSNEELAEKYLQERRAGVLRGQVSHYGTLVSRFGSIDKLNEIVGFREPEKYEPRLMSIDEVETEVNEILSKEKRQITTQVLDEHNDDLSHSIRHHYGSILAYFTQRSDIDYFGTPKVPFEWTKENVERHLKRWIREGKPVNYVAVAQDRRGILDASLRLYGGWKYVFEAIGLDYEDYRVDTDMASAYGFEFEDLVAEILSELGVDYQREPFIKGCHPDYVVGDHWIDAKLSEWTIRAPDCETVKKYEPHCKKLSIYYLRGYGQGDGITEISDKTTLYPVSILIDKLPKVKRKIYEDRTNEILEGLSEKAS